VLLASLERRSATSAKVHAQAEVSRGLVFLEAPLLRPPSRGTYLARLCMRWPPHRLLGLRRIEPAAVEAEAVRPDSSRALRRLWRTDENSIQM
jgi:hypothetical protein